MGGPSENLALESPGVSPELFYSGHNPATGEEDTGTWGHLSTTPGGGGFKLSSSGWGHLTLFPPSVSPPPSPRNTRAGCWVREAAVGLWGQAWAGESDTCLPLTH